VIEYQLILYCYFYFVSHCVCKTGLINSSSNGYITPFTDFNPANYIWCPRTDIFANGDGYYLYPGVNGPVPTCRLSNIRDGLEDLSLLRMIDDTNSMNQYIYQIVTGPTQYDLNPVLLEKIRREVAQQVMDSRKRRQS